MGDCFKFCGLFRKPELYHLQPALYYFILLPMSTKSSYKSFYVAIRSGYNQIIVNKTFILTVENLWFSLFFSTQPILKSTKCWRMCSIQWDELYAPPSLHTALWLDFSTLVQKLWVFLPSKNMEIWFKYILA